MVLGFRAFQGKHTKRIISHALIFIALLICWESASNFGLLDEYLYPKPSGIFHSFWVIYVKNASIWHHLWVTIGLVLLGFAGGSIAGVSLGSLVGFNPTMRRFLQPYIIVIEATPRIAVAPLLIAALGFGIQSKVAIIILVCFFAPFINTLSGVINVGNDKLELFKSLGATKRQILVKLVFPEALPTIMAGERLAMTAALSGALVAEFIQRDQGLGSLILLYSRNLNMSSAFACIFTLTVLGFFIFKGMEILDRRIAFWTYEAGRIQRSNKKARKTLNLLEVGHG